MSSRDRGGEQERFVWRVAFLFVLGLWIGAMVSFAAITAPAAFAALASVPGGRHMAGSIVANALGTLNVAAYVLAPLLMVLLFIGEVPDRRWSDQVGWVQLLFVAMAVAAVISQGYVSSRMGDLRAAMGVIDNVAPTDPNRMEFQRLHYVSVGLMLAQILAGVAAFVLTSRRWMRVTRRAKRSRERD